MAGADRGTLGAAGGMRGITSPGRDQSTLAYPSISLTDVIKMVDVIKERGGRCRFDDLAWALGQQKSSGAFRGRTGAGRMFGAVETAGSELVLTELGERICSPVSQAEALAEAFLRAPLYKALYDRYAVDGGKVPDSATIESDMIRLGVPEKRIGIIRRAFLRSAEAAGYFRSGPDRLIRPSISGGSIIAKPASAPEPKEPPAVTPAETTPSTGHPFIEMLVAALPPPGSQWSEEQLQRWLARAEHGLRFAYEVIPEASPGPSANGYDAEAAAAALKDVRL